MNIKSRTLAVTFAVMALGTALSGAALAQTQGGGRGGSAGGDSGVTMPDGKAYATVPSNARVPFIDPNDTYNPRSPGITGRECLTPTEGRLGVKAFTGSCRPL